jgi:hypothetical protein
MHSYQLKRDQKCKKEGQKKPYPGSRSACQHISLTRLSFLRDFVLAFITQRDQINHPGKKLRTQSMDPSYTYINIHNTYT